MKALFNIASILLAHWNLLNACALAASDRTGQETFIYWSAAPLERLADGRIKAVLTLENPGVLENPAAYYRLARLGRDGGPEALDDAEIHGWIGRRTGGGS